jgi:ribosome-associated translation inhibitor RaiA/peroxiredoxin
MGWRARRQRARAVAGLAMASAAFVTASLHSGHAAVPKTVVISPADQAWKALKHACETPPPPLKQLPDRMYTQQEIRDYYTKTANRAGAVADQAKAFAVRYPHDPQAAKAQEIYFNMLHAAVALSSTTKIAELETATAQRQQDPKLDDTGRFQLALRLLQSAVSGRQYESDDAMRAELEKRARQLAKHFPTHPDGDKYLLNLAVAAEPEKSESLAREVLARSSDADIKAECQGLISRSEAVGKPLDLTLPLKDGKPFDLTSLRGKVALLLFWDSAARFSSKAVWGVNELYKTHHAKGLEVVGLNFDADPAKAADTLADVHPDWPQYYDVAAGRTLQERFGVHVLPMCWIVDKKGVLRELHGERDPVGIVDRLLAE